MARIVTDRSVAEVLNLASAFFMKRDDVHETMRRLSTRLLEEGISHAILGGMALALHGYLRVTADVDVLTTPDGLARIHERLVGRGYVPSFPGARKSLRDTQTGVTVEFITAGEYPGDGKPKPVRFPEPSTAAVDRDGLSVISLPKLIELKLASGLTAEHRKYRDLGDVQAVISALRPPRELGEELDSSVRDEYYRLWDAAQAPDPFDERPR
jgi:hypothetical protein